jgi:hypothetical protein
MTGDCHVRFCERFRLQYLYLLDPQNPENFFAYICFYGAAITLPAANLLKWNP